MKRRSSKIVVLAFVFMLSLFSFTNKQVTTGKIFVTVYNIKNNSGKVLLSLYNSSADYPTNPDKAFRKAASPIVNNTASFVLDAVPYGTYAVAVLHDENDNLEMDSNFMGIPKEGLGASRDAKGSMGPPKFEDAKFQVSTPSTSLKIKMNYIF